MILEYTSGEKNKLLGPLLWQLTKDSRFPIIYLVFQKEFGGSLSLLPELQNEK